MKYFVILLILVGIVAFAIPQIFACECIPMTFDEKLMNADVVFQGTIIHEPLILERNLIASFSARDVFKKPPSEFDYLFEGPFTNVTTGIDSGICGVNFLVDNTYIVFGTISDGKIQTSSCSGTVTIDNYLDQILSLRHYGSSPYEQFNSGIAAKDVKCRDSLQLVIKYNGSPACVKPETKQKLIERGWAKDDNTIPTFDYVIEKDGVTYGSQYQISGGTVDEIFYDKQSNSLVISLHDSEKGFLQIVIQTGLLHSLEQMPFTYFVIVDGEEVVFEQLSPIIVKIPFEKGTKQIEIVGTTEI